MKKGGAKTLPFFLARAWKVGSSISITAIMVNNEAILKTIDDLNLQKTPNVVQTAIKIFYSKIYVATPLENPNCF